ncbi:MAG: hypothetical protein SGPRY_010777 [Prymnesium sp.]
MAQGVMKLLAHALHDDKPSTSHSATACPEQTSEPKGGRCRMTFGGEESEACHGEEKWGKALGRGCEGVGSGGDGVGGERKRRRNEGGRSSARERGEGGKEAARDRGEQHHSSLCLQGAGGTALRAEREDVVERRTEGERRVRWAGEMRRDEIAAQIEGESGMASHELSEQGSQPSPRRDGGEGLSRISGRHSSEGFVKRSRRECGEGEYMPRRVEARPHGGEAIHSSDGRRQAHPCPHARITAKSTYSKERVAEMVKDLMRDRYLRGEISRDRFKTVARAVTRAASVRLSGAHCGDDSDVSRMLQMLVAENVSAPSW